MADRFKDALLIQQGACNPSGIARTLVKACKECLEEGTPQRTDPAVRLIIHQLAYLVDCRDIDDKLGLYSDLTAHCEEKIKPLCKLSENA